MSKLTDGLMALTLLIVYIVLEVIVPSMGD